MKPGPPITLLTDFGQTDTYIGQMKGVIAAIAPAATVIDLTHAVPAQNVTAGAIMLDAAMDAFPSHTIHLAVVDPGVGSGRRAVALETDRAIFVGPDNGLFTAVLKRFRPQRAVSLTNARYQRDQPSPTFHGRDVFAPAAAHLALGRAITHLGDAIDPATLTQIDLPAPIPTERGLILHILWIDHFGNLVTDLRREHLAVTQHDANHTDGITLTVQGHTIRGIARTFSDVPDATPLAYFGSTGRLEIAIRNRSAACHWSVTLGDTISLQSP